MSTADAVKREIDRRAAERWTGRIQVDFKDGAWVVQVKPARGAKLR